MTIQQWLQENSIYDHPWEFIEDRALLRVWQHTLQLSLSEIGEPEPVILYKSSPIDMSIEDFFATVFEPYERSKALHQEALNADSMPE